MKFRKKLTVETADAIMIKSEFHKKKKKGGAHMIRSSSVMKNIQDVCSVLRQKYFGEAASQKDYKDSFVVNKAIDSVKGLPEDLMTESISQKDQSEAKGSKSINYRSDCYEKLSTIAAALQISESEVCRRIMYYTLEEHNGSEAVIEVSALKEKVIFLKKQMEKSMAALNEVMLAISLLENKQED